MRRYLRAIVVWAMLLPFAFSSLIANGLMPMVTPEGAIVLVICTSEGMVEASFDPVTMERIAEPGDRDAPAGDAEYCAWAAWHPAFDTPGLTALPRRVEPLRAAAPRTGPTVLVASAATGLPPSTGPPLTF